MPKGTVVITSRGTVGALAQLRREMSFNSLNQCYPPFFQMMGFLRRLSIFYALKGTISKMHSLTYGTVFETITSHTFDNWQIPLPSLPEQRAIAHILGTLDDKIELNRRMNETLEAMARALFKSWFVDFDPVRAKIALKHHKSITPPPQANHSPLEGESASQGCQPEGEPVGGRQGKGASPQASRWGEIKRLYSPQTLKRAKALRQSQSNAEGLLWHYLRKKQLDGHKFRRQQPIGRYIVDFVCMPKKLVIELDGGQHSTQKAYDEHRDKFLRERGYQVLRFWNSKVFENCYWVLESILAALQDDATKVSESPPSPSTHHSPLEVESERQGPQPAGEPVGRRQSKDASPKLSRSPVSTPPQGGSDWTVERAKAYLDKIPPDIADLFPDRLVDSELGEIPEGWEVKRIEDIAERVAMGPFGSSIKVSTFVKEGIPVISGQHLNGTLLDDKEYRYITEEHANKLAKANVQRGDVIFTHAGNIGQVACIPQTSQFERYVISQRQFYMRCDFAQISPLFVVYFFKTPEGRHQLLANTSSTGVPSISRPVTYLRSIKLCIPPKVLLNQFNEIVGRLHLKFGWNTAENDSLAALRETLLPKLISGQIRIKNVATFVESTEDCQYS